MYQSPTDMGVNRASAGIVNDSIIVEASRQEIIRRYFRCAVEYAMGMSDKDTLDRINMIMIKVGTKPEDRKVVLPARMAAKDAENVRERSRRNILRSFDGTARRNYYHRKKLPSSSCIFESYPQCRQAPGRASRQDVPSARSHNRLGNTPEKRYSRWQDGKPRCGRDTDCPGHKCPL